MIAEPSGKKKVVSKYLRYYSGDIWELNIFQIPSIPDLVRSNYLL